jgi:hypothetical protein
MFTVEVIGQNTWVKTYGGSKNEESQCIIESVDGSFLITGHTSSNDGCFIEKTNNDLEPFIIKVDKYGNIIWTKTVSDLKGRSSIIKETLEGNLIVICGTYFVMLDKNGNTIWKKTYSGIQLVGLTTTKNGDYLLTGYTDSNDGQLINKGKEDCFVLKVDNNGETLWIKTIGGSQMDYGVSTLTDDEDNIFVTGYSFSNDFDFSNLGKGGGDIFLVKLDKYGNIVKVFKYGGKGFDGGVSIYLDSNNCLLITGSFDSNDGDFYYKNIGKRDIFIMKLDSNYNITSIDSYGDSSNNYPYQFNRQNDHSFNVIGDNVGDLVNGYYDVFVMNIDSIGKMKYNHRYGGSQRDRGRSIIKTKDGNLLVSGYTNSNDLDFIGINIGGDDLFIMKLDSNGNLNNTTSINEFSEPTTTLSVHPNPFSNTTTISYKVETPSNISIELLNTLGQTIEVLRNDYSDSGTYQLPLNVSNLTSGMYSVRMRSGSNSMVVPVWVIK